MSQQKWEPRSQAQRDALACTADILLFGGAAGSLKSETMLMDAIQERDNPNLRALLVRRTYPELEMSLIRRSRELYPGFGGKYNEARRSWKFDSGATVDFGYCESDKDVHRYQGAEFSFIGFDESTHFTEFIIRYMLSRLRSTDPNLRVRLRLASNPGNIGHNTHKHIFLGPTCTHCRTTDPGSRAPNVIYDDALWPTDKHPIGKTTCFIPGRLSDHDLLGGAYAQSLASLPGAFRKALLDGCWDIFEGQFFDIWNPTLMTCRRPSIGDQHWWPHWVGVDYGFSGSQAVAYLLCRSEPQPDAPKGRIYVLDEYAAKHQTAADFAIEVKKRFHRDGEKELDWFLSPDAWNDRGDGHALANQMNEASGIRFTRANNDRLGGAMLLYTLLNDRELIIADTCPQLIASIPSRRHSKERPDDIEKITNDPLDDCIDALRYAVYSHVPAARPPAAMRYEAMVNSRDPTQAALQRRQAEILKQQLAEPIHLVRNGHHRPRPSSTINKWMFPARVPPR